ncbi:class I SAM-dependent methyltransferase [Candidatus Micrarchaeota archaeon]|nr:class I SAM-dependent methyltransferase [Candidatus Micrarchaeota archaeon]
MDPVEAFDEIAEEWNEYRKRPSHALSLLLEYVTGGEAAVDAGCGNCRNSIAIAEKFDKVFAFDASKKMVDSAFAAVKARGLEGRIIISQAKLPQMPLDDSFADAVFLVAVLHHLKTPEDRLDALNEANRVLKPGGRLLLTVWNKRLGLEKKDALIAWRKKDGSTVQRYYYFFSEDELKELAEKAGFRVIDFFFEKSGRKHGKEGSQNLCAVFEKPLRLKG